MDKNTKTQNTSFYQEGFVLNINKMLIFFISFAVILVTALVIFFYSNKNFDNIVTGQNKTGSVESDKDNNNGQEAAESEIVNDFFDKEFSEAANDWQSQENPYGYQEGFGGGMQPPPGGGFGGGMQPPPGGGYGYGGYGGQAPPPPDGFGGGMQPPPGGGMGGPGAPGNGMIQDIQVGTRYGKKDIGATVTNILQDKIYINVDKNTGSYAYIAIIHQFDDNDLIDLQKIEDYAFCDKIIKDDGDSSVVFSFDDLTAEDGKYFLVAFPYDPKAKFEGHGWGSEYFTVKFSVNNNFNNNPQQW